MSDDIHGKLPPDSYKDYVTVEGGIRLVDVFPGGIEVEIRGDDIELLTPPDSRYKFIEGVLVRVGESAEPKK